jgi:hypothetical protein
MPDMKPPEEVEVMIKEIYWARGLYSRAVIEFVTELLVVSKSFEKAIGEISARDAYCALMLDVPRIMTEAERRIRLEP